MAESNLPTFDTRPFEFAFIDDRALSSRDRWALKLYKLGSPLYEVLNYYTKNLNHSKILRKYKVKKKNFFLVSFHRNENISSEKNLANFCLILDSICKKFNKPILISTHPGTEIAISKIIISFLKTFRTILTSCALHTIASNFALFANLA